MRPSLGAKSKRAKRSDTQIKASVTLKDKAVESALAVYERQFRTTGDAQYAWLAWQSARRLGVAPPPWVLTYLDSVSVDALGKSTRSQRTRRRYADALMQMQVRVEAHESRTRIRDVAKKLGYVYEPSRRDQANLTAIAHAVAKECRVSKNRLLAAYRAERKLSRKPSGR